MSTRFLIVAVAACSMFISVTQGALKLGDLPAGSVVYDSSWTWSDSVLDWTVVAQDHYSAGSTTLWTKAVIASGEYNDEWLNDWSGSTERNYLNTTFYNAFSADFKGQVLTTTTQNYDMFTTSYFTEDDNVFIASATEMGVTVGTHFGIPSPVLGTTMAYFDSTIRNLGTNYWTRTPAAGEFLEPRPGLCEYYIDAAGQGGAGPWVGDLLGYAPMVNLSADTLVLLEGDGRYSIIPEPCTIAMLTVGALAVLRRRPRKN